MVFNDFLPNLRHLKMDGLLLELSDLPVFFEICTRLESLKTNDCCFDHRTGRTYDEQRRVQRIKPEAMFKIKKLSISGSCSGPWTAILRYCPNIHELRLGLSGDTHPVPFIRRMEKVTDYLDSQTLPKLKFLKLHREIGVTQVEMSDMDEIAEYEEDIANVLQTLTETAKRHKVNVVTNLF